MVPESKQTALLTYGARKPERCEFTNERGGVAENF